MAEYQLTNSEKTVIRKGVQRPGKEPIDVWIPNDPDNTDWIEYQKWLAEGGVPDPYVEPPPPQAAPSGEAALYDHENRIRALEGQPAITLEDFKKRP